MNSNQLGDVLLNIVKMYFERATVIWAPSKNTQREKPYVTLKLSSAGRATHSSEIMEEDVLCGYIPSKSILRVNLFTNGRKIDVGEGMLPIFENTAVADLEDFCNFMASDRVMQICDDENIMILQKSEVLNITELLEGVDSDYRAQVEFDVDYMQVVTGAYNVSTPMFSVSDDEDIQGDEGSGETDVPSDSPGIKPEKIFVPTPSGGRTEEQVNTEIGYFVEVETESEEE